MTRLFYALIIAFIAVSPAQAEERAALKSIAAPSAPECPFVQTANISINFNSVETDINKAVGMLNTKIEEVQALAKEKEITKISSQSSNYSINPNTGGGCGQPSGQFQFYGSANFLVEPADKAGAFLAYLTEKGFNANLNVNSYRQCQ